MIFINSHAVHSFILILRHLFPLGEALCGVIYPQMKKELELRLVLIFGYIFKHLSSLGSSSLWVMLVPQMRGQLDLKLVLKFG